MNDIGKNIIEPGVEAAKKSEALLLQFRHVNNEYRLVAIKRLHRAYRSQILQNGWRCWSIFVSRFNDERDRKIVAKDLILRQTHASQQRLLRSRAAVVDATSAVDAVVLALGHAPRDGKIILSQLIRRSRQRLLWVSWRAWYLFSTRQRTASSMIQVKRFEVVKYCAKKLWQHIRTRELRILLRCFKVLVVNDRLPESKIEAMSAVIRDQGFAMSQRIENGNEESLAALNCSLEQVPTGDSHELRSASEGRPMRKSSRSVFGGISMMSVFVNKSKFQALPRKNSAK